MSKFKVGDKVTPVNMDRYTDRNSDRRKEMLGRTLVVRSVHNDEFTSVVFAGVPGEVVWQWHPNDLRLVSETQAEPTDSAHKTRTPKLSDGLVEHWGGCGFLNPYADPSPTEPTDQAPAAAQKPLRRGDLVEYDGRVCVVFSDRDLVGHFFVSALSGVSDYYHCNEEELTRIGSIRKKVKRLKAAIAKAGGES